MGVAECVIPARDRGRPAVVPVGLVHRRPYDQDRLGEVPDQTIGRRSNGAAGEEAHPRDHRAKVSLPVSPSSAAGLSVSDLTFLFHGAVCPRAKRRRKHWTDVERALEDCTQARHHTHCVLTQSSDATCE